MYCPISKNKKVILFSKKIRHKIQEIKYFNRWAPSVIFRNVHIDTFYQRTSQGTTEASKRLDEVTYFTAVWNSRTL